MELPWRCGGGDVREWRRAAMHRGCTGAATVHALRVGGRVVPLQQAPLHTGVVERLAARGIPAFAFGYVLSLVTMSLRGLVVAGSGVTCVPQRVGSG